jgi:hypothetical protein
MIRLSDGRLILTGREAADARLATMRARIALGNALAAAVRLIADLEGPVARLAVESDPLGLDSVKLAA